MVLVDFWTINCFNSLNALPFVRARAEKYSYCGLVGGRGHTPELVFQRDIGNVRKASPVFLIGTKHKLGRAATLQIDIIHHIGFAPRRVLICVRWQLFLRTVCTKSAGDVRKMA